MLWVLGIILILSAIGVLAARKPVHASLSFLLTLLMLAGIYLQLSAQFIAVMQILVYAGAILVIFMFVIILFQDAHQQITHFKPRSNLLLLAVAAATFLGAMAFLAVQLDHSTFSQHPIPAGYGTVQALGTTLYLDFFFPFEAIILLFLVAVVGALYIAKKEI